MPRCGGDKRRLLLGGKLGFAFFFRSLPGSGGGFVGFARGDVAAKGAVGFAAGVG